MAHEPRPSRGAMGGEGECPYCDMHFSAARRPARAGKHKRCPVCGEHPDESGREAAREAERQRSADYAQWKRNKVVIWDHGWTGSSLRQQFPRFMWKGDVEVGQGHIRVEEEKLLGEVVFEGIPDDLSELELTADPFRGPYHKIARNDDGKFVLPEGFDLGPALR